MRARRERRRAERALWESFVSRPAYDPANFLTEGMRAAPEGAVNSVKSDVHTPEIMAEHVKEMARKFGADLVGIVALDPANDDRETFPEPATFAVVCALFAPYDPATTPGLAAQGRVQRGLMVSFMLAAYLRETGHFATTRDVSVEERARLATRAGVARRDRQGRLRRARHRGGVWVSDVVYTDFPLVGER